MSSEKQGTSCIVCGEDGGPLGPLAWTCSPICYEIASLSLRLHTRIPVQEHTHLVKRIREMRERKGLDVWIPEAPIEETTEFVEWRNARNDVYKAYRHLQICRRKHRDAQKDWDKAEGGEDNFKLEVKHDRVYYWQEKMEQAEQDYAVKRKAEIAERRNS